MPGGHIPYHPKMTQPTCIPHCTARNTVGAQFRIQRFRFSKAHKWTGGELVEDKYAKND